MIKLLLFIGIVLSASCERKPATADQVLTEVKNEEVAPEADKTLTVNNTPIAHTPGSIINTGNTTPSQLVAFAKKMIGTPYLYGSTNPANGFDCSGFITYVFNEFNISVPRSSIDFTNVERAIPLNEAKEGDIVLFTGTNANIREVGHMGIIVSEGSPKEFIHSTSGKAYGVTITPLNEYYMGRFVKVLRIFKQND